MAVHTGVALDVAAILSDMEYVRAFGLAGVANDAAFFDPDLRDSHICFPLRSAAA